MKNVGNEGISTKTIYGTKVRIIAVNLSPDGSKSGSLTVITDSGTEIPVTASALVKPEENCQEFDDLSFFVEK